MQQKPLEISSSSSKWLRNTLGNGRGTWIKRKFPNLAKKKSQNYSRPLSEIAVGDILLSRSCAGGSFANRRAEEACKGAKQKPKGVSAKRRLPVASQIFPRAHLSTKSVSAGVVLRTIMRKVRMHMFPRGGV